MGSTLVRPPQDARDRVETVMTINADKPKLWKRDIQQSVDLFNS